MRRELVLHLHRLDDADHRAALDHVALADARRSRTVPCIGLTTASAAPTAAASVASARSRRRASSRYAGSGRSTVTSRGARRPRPPSSAATTSVRTAPLPLFADASQLLRKLRQLLRLDERRDTSRRGRSSRARAARGGSRRASSTPPISNSVERPQHPAARPLAVGVVDDQLREQRVVEPADLRPRRHARVDAHPRARRLAVARDPPRRGQEAVGRILRVDAALDRMTAQDDVLLAKR